MLGTDELVRQKYKLIEMIGNGSFGVVYKAYDVKCKNEVAVKFDTSNIGFLRHEATILNYLSSNKCKKIPLLYWFGIHKYLNSSIHCIVIPFYKCSLLQYIASNRIEVSQVDKLFNEILNVLESIHSLLVIHRDIKPENFMFNGKGELVLIDFGLSIFDMNNKKDNCNFTGNIIYASPNIHNLKTAKPIDDIISASYIYLFMCSGGILPWINLDDTSDIDDSKMRRILDSKMMNNIETQFPNTTWKIRIMKLLGKLYGGELLYKF